MIKQVDKNQFLYLTTKECRLVEDIPASFIDIIQEGIESIYAGFKLEEIEPLSVGISRKTYSVMISRDNEQKYLIIQSYENSEKNYKLEKERLIKQHMGKHLKFVDSECHIIYTDTISYLIKKQLYGSIILNPTNLKAYCFKLAEVLFAIHSVPIFTTNEISTVSSTIEQVRKHVFTQIKLKNYNILKKKLHNTVFKVTDNVLNHGDFWSGNILWKADDVSAVIDWEDALIGSRLYDIACAKFELFLAFGQEAENLFMQRYEELHQRLDQQELRKYELVACFRVTRGITGWTSIWPEYDRPDANREMFYDRINSFVDRLLNQVN